LRLTRVVLAGATFRRDLLESGKRLFGPGDYAPGAVLAGGDRHEPVDPVGPGAGIVLTARGVRVRRARIVSEPVHEYIKFEHEATGSLNVAAGEEVSWLPRRRASDLCLPGNDFWLFDDHTIQFHHFDGDGRVVEDELCTDPEVIAMCARSFEAVWERAIPHSDYRLS
jgi:hypothetical protein